MKIANKRLLAMALMLVGGQIYAQPSGQQSPPETTGGSELSPEDMSKRATDLDGKVRIDMQHVESLQASERKKQDVIKLSCVNDKLLKLKGEANLFDIVRSELTTSLNSGERFAVYPRVGVAAGRVHKLRNEADQCAGELELQQDASSSVTHPPIPDDPTTNVPFEGNTLVEEPAYASPYQ